MMEDFLVYCKSKDLIKYVDLYVFSSFPKYKLSLKIKFEEEMYGLLQNITRANFNKGNIRQKYIIDCLVNISLMDTYISYIYEHKIIIKKRFLSIVNKLDELRKLIIRWQNECTLKKL